MQAAALTTMEALDVVERLGGFVGDRDGDDEAAVRRTSTRPKRALMLVAYILSLGFCVVIVNTACSFLLKLLENDQFFIQLSHLMKNGTCINHLIS